MLLIVDLILFNQSFREGFHPSFGYKNNIAIREVEPFPNRQSNNPGTHKIHVSFIEALSLIQQEWAPLSFITILFLYPEKEGELNQPLPGRLIKESSRQSITSSHSGSHFDTLTPSYSCVSNSPSSL
jgi:hypothetical protein